VRPVRPSVFVGLGAALREVCSGDGSARSAAGVAAPGFRSAPPWRHADSRGGCAGAQQLFEVGERVHALIVGMNPDGTRISLSTAELEAGDGDMLENKARGQSATHQPNPLGMAAAATLTVHAGLCCTLVAPVSVRSWSASRPACSAVRRALVRSARCPVCVGSGPTAGQANVRACCAGPARRLRARRRPGERRGQRSRLRCVVCVHSGGLAQRRGQPARLRRRSSCTPARRSSKGCSWST
jgi:hypothetical protein